MWRVVSSWGKKIKSGYLTTRAGDNIDYVLKHDEVYLSKQFRYYKTRYFLILTGYPVESKGFWRWRITLRVTGFLDFVHRLEFSILENTTFRKLDLSPSSGEGSKTPTLYFLKKILKVSNHPDRLCGLVVRVPGYRSRGPGSIPATTTFSE
jgi:hypothetical protein